MSEKQAPEKVVEAAEKAGEAVEKVGEAAEATKTWPEVADKALDGLQEGIGKVGDVVHKIGVELSETAPQIWNGLVEYHRWIAIGELISTLLWIIAAIILIYFGKKNFTNAQKEGYEGLEKGRRSSYGGWSEEYQFKFVAGIVMMAAGCVICFINLAGIHYTIADVVVPERAAAIEVINVVKSGGKVPER